MENKYKELYKTASLTKENAYAPYSNFKVGAAILTEKGEVYTGVNIENSSFGATICAERSAVCKAVTAGDLEFKAIAIASSGGEAWPCGICWQVLFEFNEDMDVITGSNENHLEVVKLSELLKNGFKL